MTIFFQSTQNIVTIYGIVMIICGMIGLMIGLIIGLMIALEEI